MSDAIELIKGDIYYYVAFYDKNLCIPWIKTYIYEGHEEEHGHLFINAAGHVAEIEKIEEPDIHYIAYEDESLMYMLDKQRLIDWLNEEHGPQQTQKPIKYHSDSAS